MEKTVAVQKKSPWKKVWKNGKGEYTYLRKIPGGWLLRQRLILGIQFTKSEVISFRDPDETWDLDHLEVNWEKVQTERNANYVGFTTRLKIPEGWIVKEVLSTKRHYVDRGNIGISLAFVEDLDHQWEL